MANGFRSAVGPTCVAALLLAGSLAGCSDFGEPLRPTEAPSVEIPPSDANVTELIPARTVVGDSVRVAGSGFGSDAAGAAFRFPDGSGDTIAAGVLSWSDTELVVQVPAGAAAGATRFERSGASVAGPHFATAPRRISYSRDLVPLFDHWGCTSCHGGSGNLNVRPWAALLAGNSDHGPVVAPRRSGESLIVERVSSTTPPSLRMPEGGPYLDAATILLLADWIDQGARDD